MGEALAAAKWLKVTLKWWYGLTINRWDRWEWLILWQPLATQHSLLWFLEGPLIVICLLYLVGGLEHFVFFDIYIYIGNNNPN